MQQLGMPDQQVAFFSMELNRLYRIFGNFFFDIVDITLHLRTNCIGAPVGKQIWGYFVTTRIEHQGAIVAVIPPETRSGYK